MLNTIILLIPVLLLISAVEWYLGTTSGAPGEKRIYTAGNFTINLAIGAIDQVFSLVYFTALYFTLDLVYRNFRLFEIEDHWYHWVTAYVVVDFISYWYHRFSHRINILWAGHVTHHSSEHFNFSNGFRTSFFQGIHRILFWSVLPVFGFTPVMLVVILKVSGLYDFLLHTTLVPKLGFLEKILVTPSQHRVHHGRNDLYIDKNYGSTFVIWDKLFGTFQEETEMVEYGIKGAYIDNNPYHAVGYYYRYLWRAMKMTPGFAAKLNLLFLPPDRTPEPDMEVVKLPQELSPALRRYAWFQVAWAATGLIVMLLFRDYLPVQELFFYSVIGVVAMSGAAMLLNGNYRETRIEIGRLLLMLLLAIAVFLLTPKLYVLAVAAFPAISLLHFLALKIEPHGEELGVK